MRQSQLYFNQNCPVCGRGMRVRIELLGKKIACQHCSAVLVPREKLNQRPVPTAQRQHVESSPRQEMQVVGR